MFCFLLPNIPSFISLFFCSCRFFFAPSDLPFVLSPEVIILLISSTVFSSSYMPALYTLLGTYLVVSRKQLIVLINSNFDAKIVSINSNFDANDNIDNTIYSEILIYAFS